MSNTNTVDISFFASETDITSIANRDELINVINQHHFSNGADLLTTTTTTPPVKRLKRNSSIATNDRTPSHIRLSSCRIRIEKFYKSVPLLDIPVLIKYDPEIKEQKEMGCLTIFSPDLIPLWSIRQDFTALSQDKLLLKNLSLVSLNYSILKDEQKLNTLRNHLSDSGSNITSKGSISKKFRLKSYNKKINDTLKNLRPKRKQLKNIIIKNSKIKYDTLSFDIFLEFHKNSFNKFTSETGSYLDLLFSTNDQSSILHHIINSPFIERHFITQTINYTKTHLTDKFDTNSFKTIPNLNVNLLPFQRQSLHWLLSKEGYKMTTDTPHDVIIPSDSDLLLFLNESICYGYEVMNSDKSIHYFWNKFTNYILDSDSAREMYVNHYYLSNNKNQKHAKGLLCEEMGLGKTIEILSLILLNKRQLTQTEYDSSNSLISYTNELGKTVLKTKTTLIICPNPLLQQWINEIMQHTNKDSVSVFHYQGYNNVKQTFNTDNINEIVRKLSQFDVIITTYNVINMEIHYTQYNANQRSRRNNNNAPRYDYSSPLSLMQFFRIILDEVQMLKSDNTQAAKCTSLLDRIHTWGVSGTPIQNVKDTQTVLSYLKIRPFCDIPDIVSNLNTNILENVKDHKTEIDVAPNKGTILKSGIHFSINELLNIFLKYDICIRHIKEDVIDQIHIPKQTKYLIPLEFNPVEWDNYINTWNEFLFISGFGPRGQNKSRIPPAQLNQWLIKLRYLCCHAVIPENILSIFEGRAHHRGFKKNQLKNSKLGQLDTQITSVHNISDILELMTINATELLDTLHRENIQLHLKAAQAKMELQNMPNEAIDIFSIIINEIKDDLWKKFNIRDPFNINQTNDKSLPQGKDKVDDAIDIIVTEDEVISSKIQIRAYIDLLHQCFFFIGTAYYFLGSKKLEEIDDMNEKINLLNEKEGSHSRERKEYNDVYSAQEMNTIHKHQLQEQMYYEHAEKLRRQMLKERSEKVDETIQEVDDYLYKKQKNGRSLTKLQVIEYEDDKNFASNFLTQKLFKSLGTSVASLNNQAKQFNEFMREVIKILHRPISKEYTEANEEEKAEEYGSSIDNQDKIYAYLHCLEEVLKNRDIVINSEDDVIKLNAKTLVDIDPNYSEFHIKLIKKLNLIKEGVSLNSIFNELKNSKIVRGSLTTVTTSNSFEDHLLSYEGEIKRIKNENKAIRESIKKLNVIYNSKIEYFTQLQRISDSLVSLIQLEPHVRNIIVKEVKTHKRYDANVNKINQTKSRVNYLKNLRKLKELIDQNKSFTCSICLGVIYLGSIMKCGHFFCKSCIHNWLKNHKTCPICKETTDISEVYNFKFKNEEQHKVNSSNSELSVASDQNIVSVTTGIVNPTSTYSDELFSLSDKYSNFPQMNEVHKIKIKESFGAKIDFVIKLILFLKLRDQSENKIPPQILLYSQNIEFLKIITHILTLNNILFLEGFQNKKTISNTIDKFKNDSTITCLLLNVRTLGTGLNLMNAKHIFLLDPIINHGDELQATSRNNRIGQTEETFVWNFMMMDSVEENIILYKHDLEHDKLRGRKSDSKEAEESIDDSDNDGANYEINADSTEMVAEKHIWHCLFRPE
ncbi:similar to Saccharomyces cerevisiae YLR247C IRC20 Putative helicase [Maudiozyma barnettii]|uniref:Similar to Saccharomyces cerevisiae YLR247C IRC20 Putative helicase n=1 Tax=Maudiozyma barnettii TaxID=61262 RepID=A0A8H2VJK3_9SACH|nr:E3 ubiquitin-protein ligase IRC20 [Kazachstania barnettii]CAB4256540.1 similar to Saccharomyces cerevisiae YLR247C IRC20 Putative helicase [Kazachstania barnettii]CAD1785143.1 similar to Saccharomyces cerevisiae YLR247C IRC20 Putative helicase [Kazachstania barnettii]